MAKIQRADETYTTASGLVPHFIVERGVTPSGGQFTSALMETPERLTFAIHSTLPREQVKALAEELALVKYIPYVFEYDHTDLCF